MTPNSFTQNDYLLAEESFLKWQGYMNEEVEDYLLSKRKEELNRLVRKVIRNELSAEDRELVRLCWYEGYSKTEIAKKLGVDRSTVFRRFDKINDTLFEKLKYAIEYRFDENFTKKAPFLIKGCVQRCIDNSHISFSQRLSLLRKSKSVTIEELSRCTGISRGRINAVEAGKAEPTIDEIKKLSVCFSVSCDYLLFGKEEIFS